MSHEKSLHSQVLELLGFVKFTQIYRCVKREEYHSQSKEVKKWILSITYEILVNIKIYFSMQFAIFLFLNLSITFAV